MPYIYKVFCDRCEFTRQEIEVVQFAVKEDGTEVVLGHPLEEYDALAATGKPREQLQREGRLRIRRAYVCVSCGEAGFYGSHANQIEGVLTTGFQDDATLGADWLIVPVGQVSRSPTLRCAACGHDTLRLFSDFTGKLGRMEELRSLFRGYRQSRFPCPRCGAGLLRWEITGIS